MSLLTGCRPKEMQRCVDETGTVVPDSYCDGKAPLQQRRNGHGGFIPFMPIYRPYYGGIGGGSLGSRVSGGSFNASPGVHYSSPSSRGFFGRGGISRGGFGHSFGSGS